ncbi:MAG: hypothetical protein AB7F78_17570 [Hyphomicrobiaceae bacterium]
MDYREIERLKADSRAFRSLAQSLLQRSDVEWTEWELDFLECVSEHELEPGPSTRQCEVLVELRDGATAISLVEGFSVRAMVEATWQARLDLDEGDEAFISSLHASGAAAIKKRAVRRLLACARRAQVIQAPLRL